MGRAWPWQNPAPDSALAAQLARGRPAWGTFIHLGWVAWVFLTPLFYGGEYGFGLRWLLLTLPTLPLFLWLYMRNVTASRVLAQRAAIGMLLLCFVLLPWYPSGLVYFVYGCVGLKASRGKLWRHFLVLLGLSLLLIGTALWVGYPWQALVWLPVVSLIIGMMVAMEEHNCERDAALRLSQEEVRRLAAMAERERIGRDLHDLLGHTLSMVALKSDLAARLVERDPAVARTEMSAVGDIARDALAEVRRAISGMRAAGLVAELASARLMLEAGGVHLEHQVDAMPEGRQVSPEAESALALALREAVTNVQRHAGAGIAWVSLKPAAGGLRLQVADDGRGGRVIPGNGLAGMRERLESVGGQLHLGKAEQGGVQLEAWVPFAPNSNTSDALPLPELET